MNLNPCPVCGKEVKTNTIISEYREKKYSFDSKECKEKFDKDPEEYAVLQKTM